MISSRVDILKPFLNDGVKTSALSNSLFVVGEQVDNAFEQAYLEIRKKENRVLSDKEVLQLPVLPRKHQHHKEWVLRLDSLNRFFKYLYKNPVKGPVLDIGCGNGWFTNILQQRTKEQVIGIDVNMEELRQASKLFRNEKLIFCYTDILKPCFRDNQFAIITLNASVQYFHSLPVLLRKLNKLLLPGGEIHLIDTPFYKDKEVNAAKKRSAKYYSNLGHKYFANQYFARSWNELEGFQYTVKYRPSFLRKKLQKSPFPWVVIHSQNKKPQYA